MVVDRDDANGGVATPPKKADVPTSKKQKMYMSRIEFANWNRLEKAGSVHEELVKPHKCFRSEYDTQQGDLEKIQGQTLERMVF